MSILTPLSMSMRAAVDDPAPGGLGREHRASEVQARSSLGTNCEITQPPPLERLVARLQKWALQALGREIMNEGERRHRIGVCCRMMAPGQGAVRVMRTEKAAHYGGLMTCGSVWVCPICGSKISETRRRELQAGMKRWVGAGGGVYHLVLTLPHYDHQPLVEVLGGLGKARRVMKNRKSWKTFLREIALGGMVRSLEVTYGVNGWHPHTHDLLFVRPGHPEGIETCEARILEMWERACVSVGLPRPNQRGCQIQDGRNAAKYVSKWGVDCEMTKSHIKRGLGENKTPWDMLRAVGEGHREWGTRFREYADAFHGRHQLEWSRGLRDELGLKEQVSDAEIASTEEEGAEFLGFIGWNDWKVILAEEKRGELLEVAYKEGWSGVLEFIRELVGDRGGRGNAKLLCSK